MTNSFPTRRSSDLEVGLAVERVDDEARLARLSLDLARLLHQETPAGTRVGQFVVQRAFGRLVGLRHEIGQPFLRNLQMLDLAKVAAQLGDRKSTRLNSSH